MSLRPRFSVLVPTYNHAAYLGPALDSLLAAENENSKNITPDPGR